MTDSFQTVLRCAALSCLALQLACGDTSAPQVATSLAVNSSTDLSAVAGSAVADAPSVVVHDARGTAMSGVLVTFAVVTGGGSITNATQRTDATGMASVGNWTLGPIAGPNSLSATVGALPTVTFAATGVAGPAAILTKAAGGGAQSATVGSAVAAAPAVTVTDSYGNPVSGVTVTFTVTSGGGSITGGTVISNSAGVAAVGSWTLGVSAGSNIVTARVAGTSLVSLDFNATGVAGPAASVVKSAGDEQTTSVSTTVLPAPAVTVSDVYGNPVAGVSVVFTVASGAGTVVGGTVTSNAAGVATVGGWRLGASAGVNTLTASPAGLPPVTFSATAVDYCAQRTSYTIGSSVVGALTSSDCRLPGAPVYSDRYTTTVSLSGAYRFTQSSGEFDTFLFLAAADGTPIASNDDDGGTNSAIKILLPSATYLIDASSYEANAVGGYTLSSSAVSETITFCEEVYILPGVSTVQALQSTDCQTQAGNYNDVLDIYLRAGQQVTIRMTSTAVDSHLTLAGNGVFATNDNLSTSTLDAQIVHTVPSAGYYSIIATSSVNFQTGTYTLSVQ